MRTLKRVFLAGLACFVSVLAEGATPKFNGYLANEAGEAYAKTYPFPMNSYSADQISFQLNWATQTIPSFQFSDGSIATGKITVSSSPAQGIAGETVCIDNICLGDGGAWTHDPLGFSSGTAVSIANAINANTILNTLVVASTGAASVIYTSSTLVGTAANFALYSSSNTALGLTTLISSTTAGVATGNLTGGTNAAYTIVNGSATVIVSTNPFSPLTSSLSPNSIQPTGMVGLPVLFSTGSGTAISGLQAQSTYYVIPINANSFGLASSAANAAAGTYINLKSSMTKTTADSFTLAPLAYAGTGGSANGGAAAGLWQVSNDGANWANLNISTVTFTPVFPSSTTSFDLGTSNYAWIRFNLNTPLTGGGLIMQIIPNAKNSYQ